MTNLIQTIKLVSKISYKVVITIDDLDRVPLPKVSQKATCMKHNINNLGRF